MHQGGIDVSPCVGAEFSGVGSRQSTGQLKAQAQPVKGGRCVRHPLALGEGQNSSGPVAAQPRRGVGCWLLGSPSHFMLSCLWCILSRVQPAYSGEVSWTRAPGQLQAVLVPPLALASLQQWSEEGFCFTGSSVLPVTSSLLQKALLSKASRAVVLLKLRGEMLLFRNPC